MTITWDMLWIVGIFAAIFIAELTRRSWERRPNNEDRFIRRTAHEQDRLNRNLQIQQAILERDNKRRFNALTTFYLERLADLASEHQLCANTTEIPESLHTSPSYRAGFEEAWRMCNAQCAAELHHRVRQLQSTTTYAAWKRKYELGDRS
jgi:hypothetical protein